MQDYVILPAHNEAGNIELVISKIKKHHKNIIVVDDGSRDNTAEIAKKLDVIVLKHAVNLGKGSALKTGCDYALYQGAKRLVVIDADGQHQPKDIPKFLSALEEQDIIYSYRKPSGTMPFVLKFGNKFINTTLNTLCRTKIKDSQCGFRAFTAEAYKKIRWSSQDYYMETEMIIKASKHRLKYSQIPIETIYGDRYKGTTVIDGVKIVLKIIGGKLFK